MSGTGKARIQSPAPEFSATAVSTTGEFVDLKLSDYRGGQLRSLPSYGATLIMAVNACEEGKWVVLFFYPLDFTFVCPTEIIAFSNRVQEFKDINCEVIAASCDSEYCHLAWTTTPKKEGGLGQMNIPLLADKTQKIARDYGVLLEDQGVPLRGLFIIDAQGILRQMTINDLAVGRSVDETLRLVQAFQYTDKYGEVCPAGWKPGADTIVPDVKKSKDYFVKQ